MGLWELNQRIVEEKYYQFRTSSSSGSGIQAELLRLRFGFKRSEMLGIGEPSMGPRLPPSHISPWSPSQPGLQALAPAPALVLHPGAATDEPWYVVVAKTFVTVAPRAPAIARPQSAPARLGSFVATPLSQSVEGCSLLPCPASCQEVLLTEADLETVAGEEASAEAPEAEEIFFDTRSNQASSDDEGIGLSQVDDEVATDEATSRVAEVTEAAPTSPLSRTAKRNRRRRLQANGAAEAAQAAQAAQDAQAAAATATSNHAAAGSAGKEASSRGLACCGSARPPSALTLSNCPKAELNGRYKITQNKAGDQPVYCLDSGHGTWFLYTTLDGHWAIHSDYVEKQGFRSNYGFLKSGRRHDGRPPQDIKRDWWWWESQRWSNDLRVGFVAG